MAISPGCGLDGFPILSILLGIPVLGILFMSLIRANNANAERNLKQTALWISFLNFLASILLLILFGTDRYFFLLRVKNYIWLELVTFMTLQ